jgi:hypothetical protein
LSTLFDRLSRWARPHASDDASSPVLLVSHAGCMQVWAWIASGRAPPQDAANWPASPPYGHCWQLALPGPNALRCGVDQ